MIQPNIVLPAEWQHQSAIQLTWPHKETDWCDILDEVIPCYIEIARAICSRQKLLIVTPDIDQTKKELGDVSLENISFFEMMTNDTWARDHGAISVVVDSIPYIYDFTFNGWGMKFAANYDNQITQNLFFKKAFAPEVKYKSQLRFVLEGGSIESDGQGTILTTSECLLSINRNNLERTETEEFLKETLGVNRLLWLDHGYLSGDDTDSHIDTLARLCDIETIAFVKCEDEIDEHYPELKRMEDQLKTFRTLSGNPYRLIELPMADPVFFENERLPATYANFLIINGAVLLPTYNSDKDGIAKMQLQKAFPDREIIGVNCLPLIKQHGSLHCITMQYPNGFVI